MCLLCSSDDINMGESVGREVSSILTVWLTESSPQQHSKAIVVFYLNKVAHVFACNKLIDATCTKSGLL